MIEPHNFDFDILVVGGGINGAGIARDAAGRGYSVLLTEMADLASGTSSASTKLIHGGLRYLEYYEFRLVREALMEREVLWRNAPHIIWPMRFVLPYQKGLRPAWLLRLGLFLYDHLGGRKLLPPTKTLDLRRDPAGKPLKLAVVTNNSSDWWTIARRGAEQAAKEIPGIRVDFRLVPEGTAAAQKALVADLLARRLHDSLGSSMTALTMHLGLLSQHLQEQPQRDRAAQMKQLLNNIIETNRKMQLALWNDKLEFLGPKAAIAELVQEWSREHGIKAKASMPDDDSDYTRAQGVALLRCAEEGLRNIVKHAQAAKVDVILDDDGDQAMLTVRDDGVGPGTAASPPASCYGLRMLRERARTLGGTLTIGAGPDGKGTALTLVFPKQGN